MAEKQNIKPGEIREQVRRHYSRLARQADTQASAGCCTEGPDKTDLIYDLPEVADLPSEVRTLSAGCGDPITLAELKTGQVVLDLGAGGGIDCFLAAQRVGPEGFVIGVDMTADMVEKARANQAKLQLDNVEFRLGEIEHLPVADSQVDVIISNCVINLSADKPQVFREAYRVLKPGGRLAISDIVTDGPLPPELEEGLEAWSGCVAGAMDRQEYIRGLEEAGFIDVELTARQSGFETPEAALSAAGIEVSNTPDALGGKPVVNVGGEWIAIESEGYHPPYSARITGRKP